MPHRPFSCASVHFRSAVLLLLTSVALYGATLDDEWHLDDGMERIRSTDPAGPNRGSPGDYRGDLALLLWRVDARTAGDSGVSYHLTNVLLHATNALLLYGIVLVLAGPRRRGRHFAALAGAMAFCAHPLATESVAYLTQRSTSVAAACVLATVLGWTAFRREDRRRRWAWLALAALAAGAGTHAKHVALLAPGLAWLADTAMTDRPRWGRLTMLAFAGLLLLLAPRTADLAHRAARLTGGATAGRVAATTTRHAGRPSWRDYARTEPGVVATYARLLVLPTGQNLDRDVPLVRSFTAPAFLLPMLMAGVVVAAALRWRRRAPLVALGAAWFLLALAPTSSFVPSADLAFEHRAYLSLAGAALALAGGARHLREVAPRFAAPALLGVLVLFGVATVRRVAVWDTELSLWSDVVAKSPHKARGHLNLGVALERAGRFPEAEAQARATLGLDPGNPLALNNLGNLLCRRGALEEAEVVLRAAVDSDPAFAEPRFNLGNLAMLRDEPREAERWFRRAISLGLTSPVARRSLDACLARQIETRADGGVCLVTSPTSRRPFTEPEEILR